LFFQLLGSKFSISEVEIVEFLMTEITVENVKLIQDVLEVGMLHIQFGFNVGEVVELIDCICNV